MQSVTKRFIRFRKATNTMLRTPRATFATRTKATWSAGRKFMPALGVSSALLFGLNKYSKFGFSSIQATAEEEIKEFEITGHEEMQNGEMKALSVGPEDGDKILIAKHDGKIYALSNFCTHFGVPLAGSVLFDDKVICPAHNAAFSIIDGYPEYAPAKNGLQTFEVVEKDGKLFAKVPSNFKDGKEIHMATRDDSNKTRVVIVGGGAAGLSAAETLRQSDYTGEIIILSAEDHVAYDRTLLSKALAKGEPEKWHLREKDFLDKYGIEFRTGSRVKSVDTANSEIKLTDDSSLKYHKLLLATGGHPKRPILPGIDLQGVHCLRNAQDQEAIKAEVGENKKVLVIGASFIGYECAANLVSTYKENIDVNVVDMSSTPFEHSLGKEVGGVLQKLGEENGIKFHLGNGISKIIGENGRATGVELSDGTKLEADTIIMGAGIQPSTQFIQDGIELGQDGSVKVNPFMQTSANNVYAAGDIANYPYHVTGERVRVEHWNHATQQGEVAAYNILDKSVPYDVIPFFWTRNFMKTLVYTGYHRQVDEIHVDGSLEDQKFTAYYIKNNKVQAVASLGKNMDVHIIKEAMRLGVMPNASEIKDGSVTVEDIKQRIRAKPGSSACRRKSCCQKKGSK